MDSRMDKEQGGVILSDDGRKRRGWIMLVLGAIILVLFVFPLTVPVSSVEDVLPLSELADADSRFTNLGGVNIHYKTMGKGKTVFLLLHGFGASLYSWRKVMPELAKYGTVVAYDRLGFGLTERLLPGQWTNGNPYAMAGQIETAFRLLDALGCGKAIWVGHSAGGAMSVIAAGKYPGKIEALVLVDPAILQSGPPALAKIFSTIPSVDHFGPILMRNIKDWGMDVLAAAWYDTNKITPEDILYYKKPLGMSNWDAGLWEYTKANAGNDAKSYTGKIKIPVLLVTGDHDTIVPVADTVSLTNLIPQAKLAVIPDSGHMPHEEQPAAFTKEVEKFVKELNKK